jgi:hypothetical protein
MTWYTIRMLICPSIIRSDDEDFPSGSSSVWRSFELFQLASVRTFQQYVRTLLSVRSAMEFFFPKHRYGKIAATVWTMWILVWTRSSIRQVVHSKSRHSDASLHGPDARATSMEIACIRSIIRTTIPMVRTSEALIWKLRAAEVRSSGRQGNTVWTQLKSGKNFCKFWKADRTVFRPDALCLPSERCLGISSQKLIWTYSL